MKSKKKKILLTLLSAACLTAGAFGITACKDKKQTPPPATLQSSYSSYVQNVGQDALSYKDWLALIKQDITANVSSKTILSAAISGNQFNLTYKDGTVKPVGTVTGSFNIKVLGDNVSISAAKSAVSAAPDDAEIKNEYGKYSENVGESALSYDNWLSLITQDFVLKTDNLKSIKSAEINTKAQLIITYQDNTKLTAGLVGGNFTVDINGTAQTVEVPVFTVTAVDQHGDPVKDVWVKLSSYNSTTYTSSTIETGKTNAEGKAYFAYKPQRNAEYRVGLADDVKNTIPTGYKLDLGVENGMTVSSVLFDAERKATMTFKYAPDDFHSAQKTEINYKRVYSGGRAKETNLPTETEIQANRYAYFIFAPYTAATTTKDEDKAVAAATGKYKISVSASASAKVVMYHYDGSTSFMSCDPDTGIPTAIAHATGNAPQNAADASVYSGTNSIELNLYSNIVRGDNIFGVVADKACTVSITVERIGDATEPPVAEKVEVKVTGNPQQCAEQSGTLTEVATDGSVNIVKGNDGYYHIGDKNGPILYATLGKPLRRVSDVAIKDMPKQKLEGQPEPLGEIVFLLTAEYDENGFATLVKDYNAVVKKYGELCNSDGVYAVNQDLYDFLHLYGNNCFGVIDLEDKSLAWLLPCQYYAQ
ncbi:MAG: hypothetical protein K2K60_02470 [Clostridia bacterium]|nr:hypothetical protein [Clostridia bacterium]